MVAALKSSGAKGCSIWAVAKGSSSKRSSTTGPLRTLWVWTSPIVCWRIARERLKLDRLPATQQARLTLMQGALTYRDKRLTGYDAAAVVEVIEHLDPPRLAAFERVLFEFARPGAVVMTTPNAEYNVKFEALPAGSLRHRDHRFEWTRAEFQTWATGVAARFHRAIFTYRAGRPEAGSPNASRVVSAIAGTVRGRQAWEKSSACQRANSPFLSWLSLCSLVPPVLANPPLRDDIRATEILASDVCRGLVCDDENDQTATRDAFEVLRFIAAKRLAAGRLTVVDATNVQTSRANRSWRWRVSITVCQWPSCSTCLSNSVGRNRQRPERAFGARRAQPEPAVAPFAAPSRA